MADDLETGWLPTTPEGDSVEGDFIHTLAERIQTFAAAGDAPNVIDDRVAIACMSRATPWGNLGVLRRPDVDVAALGAELIDDFGPGTPVALLSPWPTDLTATGMVCDGHPPLMIRPPGPPDPTDRPATAREAEITEVTDADGLTEWEQVLFAGYPFPGADAVPPLTLFPPALLGSATRFWTVRSGGEPVAVAAGHLGRVVEVEFVATLAEHRGAGFGALATWLAAAVAPTSTAVLVASDGGRPVYERLGYMVTRRWSFWFGELAAGRS